MGKLSKTNKARKMEKIAGTKLVGYLFVAVFLVDYISFFTT